MVRRTGLRRGRGAAVVLSALLAAAGATVAASGVAAALGVPGPGNRWAGHGWYGLKGTVAAAPAPSTASFTLDAVGCSTPVAVTVTASTVLFEPGTDLTPRGVAPGERIVVSLIPGASTPTARTVTILLSQISGTVQGKGAASLTVLDAQGFTRTVDVSGATDYTPAGTSLTTISQADRVDAVGTVAPDDSTLDAVAVHAQPPPPSVARRHRPFPQGSGTVAATPTPGAAGFTLVLPGGATEAVTTTGSTRYAEPGMTSPTGVFPGERVTVWLVRGAPAPTAKLVVVDPAELDGTVQSVSSSSFVLADQQGFWWTVNVGPSTTWRPSTAALASLTGDQVVAEGLVDPDGMSLDAQLVKVHTPMPTPTADQQIWYRAISTCPSLALTPAATPASVPSGPVPDPAPPGQGAGPVHTGASASHGAPAGFTGHPGTGAPPARDGSAPRSSGSNDAHPGSNGVPGSAGHGDRGGDPAGRGWHGGGSGGGGPGGGGPTGFGGSPGR